ncbi:serine-rich adhesin for platelets-like [Palaemon carinicauda]|uniref:serine-rich adhesin for platelets-like n=1 Tax=Palaemon carinicauda TaxID=392227 RepID=UPI0035B574BF
MTLLLITASSLPMIRVWLITAKHTLPDEILTAEYFEANMRKSSHWPSSGDATEEDALKDKMELERQSSEDSIGPPIHQCPSVEEKKREKDQQFRNIFRSNKVGVGDEVQEVMEVPRGNVPPSATFRTPSGRSEFQEVEFTEAKTNSGGRLGLPPGNHEGATPKSKIRKKVSRVFGSCDPVENSDEDEEEENTLSEGDDGDGERDGDGDGDNDGDGCGGNGDGCGDDGDGCGGEGKNDDEGADGNSDSEGESDITDDSDETEENETKDQLGNSTCTPIKADEDDSTGVKGIREKSAIKRGTGSIGNVAVVARVINKPYYTYSDHNRPSTSEATRFNSGASTSKDGYHKGQGPSRDSSFTDATDLTSGSAREDTTLTIEEEDVDEEHKQLDPARLRKAQMNVPRPFLTASSLAIYSQIHHNGVSKLGTYVLGTSLVCTFVVTIVLTVLILIAPKTFVSKPHIYYSTEAPTAQPNDDLVTESALPMAPLVWRDLSIDLKTPPISLKKTNPPIAEVNSDATSALLLANSKRRNDRKDIRTFNVDKTNVQRLVLRKDYNISHKRPNQPTSNNVTVTKAKDKTVSKVRYNNTNQLPFVNIEESTTVYPSNRNLSVFGLVNNTEYFIHGNISNPSFLNGLSTSSTNSTAKTVLMNTILLQLQTQSVNAGINITRKAVIHKYTTLKPNINVTTVRSPIISNTTPVDNNTSGQPLNDTSGLIKGGKSVVLEVTNNEQSLNSAMEKEVHEIHKMPSNITTHPPLIDSMTGVQNVKDSTVTSANVSQLHFHDTKNSSSVQSTPIDLNTETRLNSTASHIYNKGKTVVEEEKLASQNASFQLDFVIEGNRSNIELTKEQEVNSKDIVEPESIDNDTNVLEVMNLSRKNTNLLTLKPNIAKTSRNWSEAIPLNATESQLLLNIDTNTTLESNHGSETQWHQIESKALYNDADNETENLSNLKNTEYKYILVSKNQSKAKNILETRNLMNYTGKPETYNIIGDSERQNFSEIRDQEGIVTSNGNTSKTAHLSNTNSTKIINIPTSTETMKPNISCNSKESEIPSSTKEPDLQTSTDKSGIVGVAEYITSFRTDKYENISNLNSSGAQITSEESVASVSLGTQSNLSNSGSLEDSSNSDTYRNVSKSESVESTEASETLGSLGESDTHVTVDNSGELKTDSNGEELLVRPDTTNGPIKSTTVNVIHTDRDETVNSFTPGVTNTSYINYFYHSIVLDDNVTRQDEVVVNPTSTNSDYRSIISTILDHGDNLISQNEVAVSPPSNNQNEVAVSPPSNNQIKIFDLRNIELVQDMQTGSFIQR